MVKRHVQQQINARIEYLKEIETISIDTNLFESQMEYEKIKASPTITATTNLSE